MVKGIHHKDTKKGRNKDLPPRHEDTKKRIGTGSDGEKTSFFNLF
jgi:hypothetical protein